MEAAVLETLKRTSKIELHPRLLNTPLIFDKTHRESLKKIYQRYIDIALEANLPIILMTPTWKANHERVSESPEMMSINKDAVRFMHEISEGYGEKKSMIKIGGLIGTKGDAYKPSETLSTEEAEDFHSWQINQHVEAGVDYLIVETVPSFSEALGIAKAMSKTDLPYIISFVINRQGEILDKTPLLQAINEIDANTNPKPIGYMVNCVYPTFICAKNQPTKLFNRLIGCQANSSSLDHADLDNSKELKAESIEEWGNEMIKLHKEHGLKILGGCCGTSAEHLEYLVKKIN